MIDKYKPDDIKVCWGDTELDFKDGVTFMDNPILKEDIELTLKCVPEEIENYKRILLGEWGAEDKREYKKITSLDDLPSNKIVYQMDSGFWYDWDLSKKSEDELKMLFQTNVIFKKKENK